MAVAVLAAGALLGAAAGGGIGYATAGLAGAAIGSGVGAVAGLGFGAAAYALSRPAYYCPGPYQGYPGYPFHYYMLIPFPRRVFYTWA